MIKIILTAVDEPLADAWKRFCGDLDFVEIHRGNIFDAKADAFVSPANSFGFMDGGIDLVYSQQFGWDVQRHLQQIIKERHDGELLIGQAEIVETNSSDQPRFIIAAPTMRVPMILQDTINPYLATRAVFLHILHGTFSPPNKLAGTKVSDAVSSVAFPGMGTGTGRVGPNTCARQVRAAIDAVLLNQNDFPRTWAEASLQHQSLYTDRPKRLQHE